jgi:hypothetical protein
LSSFIRHGDTANSVDNGESSTHSELDTSVPHTPVQALQALYAPPALPFIGTYYPGDDINVISQT